jgi:Fic family protein
VSYTPPYKITTKILRLVAGISEKISDIKHIEKEFVTPKLRRKNRVKSITGSLQIEGNTFSEEQVTAMIDGKKVLGSYREILEVEGAIAAYNQLDKYKYHSLKDMLSAHALMMKNIITNNGSFRSSNVGVGGKDGISHIAPPPAQVPTLMAQLFEWLKNSDEHLLIKSCVFHYEFEFIHPFSDGNGRIGRLWQTVILKEFRELFAYLPIESMVKANQQKYYHAFEECANLGESTPFVEFMLDVILKTLNSFIKESQKSDQKSNYKSDQKILSLITENSSITITEMCQKLSMSESGVKKVLKKLKDGGKLKRVGSLKAGYWEVLGA